MLKQYGKFRLKNGELGIVLEFLDDETIMAEVFRKDGELETTEIKIADIIVVIKEVEEPFLTLAK